MKNVKIKLFAQQTMAVCVKYVTYSRHKNLEKTEKILALCIQNLFLRQCLSKRISGEKRDLPVLVLLYYKNILILLEVHEE